MKYVNEIDTRASFKNAFYIKCTKNEAFYQGFLQ